MSSTTMYTVNNNVSVVAEKPNWTWYTRYSGETAAFAANARNAMAAAAQKDDSLDSRNRRDRLCGIASPKALTPGESSSRIDADIPLLCWNQGCADSRRHVEALDRTRSTPRHCAS